VGNQKSKEESVVKDDNVGNAVGKWGAIGLIVGLVLPYLIGGWITNISLLTAFGGAMLFAWIAREGAIAESKDTQENVVSPAKPEKIDPPKVQCSIVPVGESNAEDMGYLRKDYLFKVNGHEMNVISAVDYNGIGPLGEKGKTTLNIIYSIPSVGVEGGLNLEYVSTELAMNALRSMNAELMRAFIEGKVSGDLEAKRQ
jgi:hypothetical protein